MPCNHAVLVGRECDCHHWLRERGPRVTHELIVGCTGVSTGMIPPEIPGRHASASTAAIEPGGAPGRRVVLLCAICRRHKTLL